MAAILASILQKEMRYLVYIKYLWSKRWVLITIQLGFVFIYLNQSSQRKHVGFLFSEPFYV
jgi:hypothetical protein